MTSVETSQPRGLAMVWGRIRELLPTAAAPKPRPEVERLIAEVKLSQDDVASIFRVYQKLRRLDGNIRTRARQLTLKASSVINVVTDHRIYIQLLLKNILQLGGCFEYTDWDHFVYILIQFCSLTRVEICQLMFLIIVRESRGLDVHYLTSTQLDRFYDIYRPDSENVLNLHYSNLPPPPESMLCTRIHFSNFPLSRYYITDFVEICFLYSQLINPIVYLQRQFRRVIPSSQFWDKYENYSLVGSRKVDIDFFLIKKTKVHLLPEDQFKETTDLLLLSSYIIQNKLKSEISSVGVDPEASAWGNIFAKIQKSGNSVHDDEDEATKHRRQWEGVLKANSRSRDMLGSKINIDLLYNQLNKSAILKRAE